MPFSWAYKAITQVRNYLYDTGYFRSMRFTVATIQVGNLTVGGSGKTPHVEYLLRLLKAEYALATLSRGYKRKSKGFLLAQAHHQAQDIGDEPMQFYRKFGPDVAVAVGESRIEAIPHILLDRPEVHCIVLDDAYQHRPLQAGLNLLLCNYHRPFFKDYPFPAGRLRESRWGAQRADAIIVSKCPEDMPETQKTEFKQKIARYARPETPLFFSGIRYGDPVFFRGNTSSMDTNHAPKILLVSGIAQAKTFLSYADATYDLVQHLAFPDHHHYTEKDILNIRDVFIQNNQAIDFLLCTEKDMVKLREAAWDALLKEVPMAYLPIEVYFLEEEAAFQSLVRDYVSGAQAGEG